VGNRRAIHLVARREVRERLRSRAFRVGLAIQLLVIAVVAVIAIATGGDDGPEQVRVATVGAEARAVGETAQAQQRAFDVDVELRQFDSAAAARAAVRDEEVDVALVGGGSATGPGATGEAARGGLLTGADSSDEAVALLQSAARTTRSAARLRAAGLSPAEIRRALDPPPLAVADVSGDEADGAGLAFVGSLLLYLSIMGFGYAVASGVIEEKTSRVIELLLSTIQPAQLLAGKVLGIGLVGLVQLLATVVVGVAIVVGSGEIDLPSSTASTAVLVAVYFVLGYALYACAFAVAGAIVSNQEDTQSTTTPMMVLLVGGYLASFPVIEEPDGLLAQILTFVPPVAPMIVPVRAAQDALPAWELALSIALMLAATIALVLLAARIYERTILRTGSPLKLSAALRLARR
jgi:ABC-2 type transport system permease protein